MSGFLLCGIPTEWSFGKGAVRDVRTACKNNSLYHSRDSRCICILVGCAIFAESESKGIMKYSRRPLYMD